MKNRVVVTGLGVVAANGIGVDAFWKSLLENQSGIGHVTLFDATGLPCNLAGEVKGFQPQRYFTQPLKLKRLARHTQLALVASSFAMKDSGLNGHVRKHSGPIPIVIGVSTSSFDLIQQGLDAIRTKGPEYATPYVVTNAGPQAIGCEIAKVFEITSSITTLSTTCAAGLDAIGTAAQFIRTGKADIAIAGSTDAPIAISPFANMVASGMVSKRVNDPCHASRPFDRERDGGVLAEGCGIVILESLDHALSRDARIYAEIAGFATHLDTPGSEPASGFTESMAMALANSSRMPAEVDLVNAHGPSDPELDRTETMCIKSALGTRAHEIPVISIKGATGNPLSAAGSLQVIATSLALHQQICPPTTNYTHPDPECDLDYVPSTPRRLNAECALLNSHGVGGGNSSLVMERYR